MNCSCDMNVTVIVVTYNSAKTIIETLDSIYNQTYKNIELIVSDDTSKDETVSLVEQWMGEKKSRFINAKIVTSLKNTGVSDNCNRGVKASSTEYYKLIAGDDLLEPTAMKMYVDFICDNPTKIGVSKAIPFGTADQSKIDLWKKVFEKAEEIYGYTPRKKYKRLVVRNYVCAPAVGLVKKEWYDQVGGFPKEYPFCEDHPMYVKLMEKGYDFILIDEYLVKYRVADGALSAGNSPLLMDSTIRYFRKEKMWKLLKCGEIPEFVMQSAYYFLMWAKYKCKK